MIFFSLFSFILAWTFISLQIKEFRIMGLSINDSVYSCLFFFLTGLHFFHLLLGVLLLSLLFWSCSFSIPFSHTFLSYAGMIVGVFLLLLNLFVSSFLVPQTLGSELFIGFLETKEIVEHKMENTKK
tara:strand:+ start:423 stop:803 length:381 start_codon:yes stop_codon:yes gene_type:complete